MINNMNKVKQIAIADTGKYQFTLTTHDQVSPGTYASTIITPVNLRPICDCDYFQELVWGNQRVTLLTTPEQVINCLVTHSSITFLGEDIYYVPGNTYIDEAPWELLQRIDKITYYYSVIKELLNRRTLFLLNGEKYSYSINNIVSIRDTADLKNYIIKLMREKHIAEDIIYYFVNENLTIWYLRKKVNK
ncbi:MAG: hypothetical protein J7J82_05745 [Staphylothermus sp.]|nr:hypothetical protein [Staphylothermus sp.]